MGGHRAPQQALRTHSASRMWQGNLIGERKTISSRTMVVDAPTPPPSESSDSLEAFREYRRSVDPQQYQDIVCSYLPLVRKIARRYVRPSIPHEDLVQIGTIGLMSAVHTFDPDRGVKFEAYAYHYVAGEIRHYLRDDAEPVQIPRWVRKLHSDLVKTTSQLQQKLGRTPTLTEIAASMNLSEKGVLEVLRVHENGRIRSIDDAVEGPEVQRELIVSQRYVSFQLPIEDQIVLMEAIERLAELQRKVIYYIFYMDLTQTEVAKRMGISQRHVSRLLAAALRRLAALLRVAEADLA